MTFAKGRNGQRPRHCGLRGGTAMRQPEAVVIHHEVWESGGHTKG